LRLYDDHVLYVLFSWYCTSPCQKVSVDVHVYEHCTKEKIDTVINNAIYAMIETQRKIKKELMLVEA
jgi:hypothetical protein